MRLSEQEASWVILKVSVGQELVKCGARRGSRNKAVSVLLRLAVQAPRAGAGQKAEGRGPSLCGSRGRCGLRSQRHGCQNAERNRMRAWPVASVPNDAQASWACPADGGLWGTWDRVLAQGLLSSSVPACWTGKPSQRARFHLQACFV